MSTTLTPVSEPIDQPLRIQDASAFQELFNRRPFKIGHHLAGHPLFELPRLVELSQQLPESRVEYSSGKVAVGYGQNDAPQTGLSPEETIRQIEECQSWLVLKNVEMIDEYRELLDACLNQIGLLSEDVAPGMYLREAFIFVTSPGSTTPYHIDPENNFLLQIRGPKEVHIWDPTDRTVFSEEDLENLFSGGHRNLDYKEAYEAYGEKFELLPGEGLHFPVAAPHWVQTSSEVSISFSITFRTHVSARQESLHRLNRQLRRLGITPTPFGQSALRDQLKYSLVRCTRGLKRLVGHGEQIRSPYGPG